MATKTTKKRKSSKKKKKEERVSGWFGDTASRESADFKARVLRNKGAKIRIRHKKGERHWHLYGSAPKDKVKYEKV